jgi:hypothetical protein
MTIHIGELVTEIDARDAQTLRTMADRVVHDRPSFRRVLGRVGDETVEIYTRRRRGARERLAVHGPRTRVEIDASDRRALYTLLAEMN